jgi:hypothetical protein
MAARFEACPLPQLRELADSNSASMSSSISSSDDWATVDISTAREQTLLFSAANTNNDLNNIVNSSYNMSSSSISATAASASSADRMSWRERWGRKRGTSDAPNASATNAKTTAKTALGPVQKSAADAAFEKAMESVTCPICLEGVVGAHNTDCSCNKTFCGELLLLSCEVQ